ncbi:MAG: hypothetical protein FMNOHCHN_03231 [Ignavibacteriaceae bacterium]|nr:hypothetical protein [Ignavibacteriaceae bacterium]
MVSEDHTLRQWSADFKRMLKQRELKRIRKTNFFVQTDDNLSLNYEV